MDVFVYGTLCDPDLMRAVAGPGPLDGVPAQLADYGVFPLVGNVVPYIAAQPGGLATGILWRGLDAAQVARLDLYEGAFGYDLQEVSVAVAGQMVPAQMYFMPGGVATDGTWSLADWQAEHLQPGLYAAEELFSHDPLPSQARLQQMWPMLEKRAWSRHHGVLTGAAPATLRHDAKPGDFTVQELGAPKGEFFRIQNMMIDHRRFDGSRSDVLPREVFVGIEAVLVLPYDPVRDRVLLVEQMRMGPVLRGDPNPWALEPVAGMVDARETPAQAAIRETVEEAALELSSLRLMTSFYPSPGSSTDYFHAYLGLCDLPDTETYSGGLDEEAEDLKLHTLDFDHAMALADSGEMTAGPMVMMMYWLARHRDEIRTDA